MNIFETTVQEPPRICRACRCLACKKLALVLHDAARKHCGGAARACVAAATNGTSKSLEHLRRSQAQTFETLGERRRSIGNKTPIPRAPYRARTHLSSAARNNTLFRMGATYTKLGCWYHDMFFFATTGCGVVVLLLRITCCGEQMSFHGECVCFFRGRSAPQPYPCSQGPTSTTKFDFFV